VGRLQSHAILLLEEALQRRAVVFEQRDDDVAVPGGVLLLHDDVVAVVDVVIDHRFAADAQDEGLATPARELARDRERFRLVLHCVDRLAGGDLPDDRRRDDPAAESAGDRECAGARGVLGEAAFLLELGEVVVDGRRRREPDGLGDLPHRRRVTPLGDALADERQDALGPLLVLFRHAWTIPNKCSPVKRAPVLSARRGSCRGSGSSLARNRGRAAPWCGGSVSASAQLSLARTRLAASPAAWSGGFAARQVSVGILRGVPIDPAVVLEYAARTFWALLVVIA